MKDQTLTVRKCLGDLSGDSPFRGSSCYCRKLEFSLQYPNQVTHSYLPTQFQGTQLHLVSPYKDAQIYAILKNEFIQKEQYLFYVEAKKKL